MENLQKYYQKTPKMKSLSVYEQMKKELLTAKWKFGEKILVNELIDKFNVSRRPVMDAMKMLESDGYIEIIPQSGCKIIDYSKKNILDQLLLSSSIESLCAEVAALYRKPEEIESLEHFQSKIKKEPNKLLDKFNYLAYTREVHLSIFMMTHSELIKSQTIKIWNLTDFYLLNTIDYYMYDPLETIHSHDKVINSIKAQNEKEARERMEQHILTYINRLKAVLP